jgi:formate hydrogenlyase subunit 6/NADH:ubiquinone oxidoreductase subunit I
MAAESAHNTAPSVLGLDGLQKLFNRLRARGYTVIGPTVRDGAVVYDQVTQVGDLPAGWTDEQSPGHYRLVGNGTQSLFAFHSPPQSWKPHLLLPRTVLWQGRRDGMQSLASEPEAPRMAFFGVHSCDLVAIETQDRVLMQGAYADAEYSRRRRNLIIVAVNCTQAGGTCFCASMNSGPKARGPFDLCLTELAGNGQRFLVESGSKAGRELLMSTAHEEARSSDVQAANQALEKAAASMGRKLDTTALREVLYQAVEHPRWDEVAKRCLSCSNCTLVCPTCFCTTVEDTTDLQGSTARRERRWDSCFTLDFSYIHGGSVRSSVRARYRHWLTHKLGTWVDQFGMPGCVGCGRCITWCPAGIDITEEATALRADVPKREAGDGND